MSLVVESAECRLGLEMPENLEHLLYDPYFAHILPGYKIIGEGDCDNTLTLKEGEPRISDYFISADWTNISKGQLAHLVLYYFQRSYADNGLLYFHGGGLEVEGAVILLLGQSKAGKSLLVRLAGTEKLARIVGDDSLVVRQDFGIVTGNKLISASLEANAYCSSRDLGAEESENGVIKAVLFLEPEIVTPLRVQSCDLDNKVIGLFKASSEDVLGVGYCLVNAGFPLPSYDTKEFAVRRLDSIKKVANDIQGHRVGGRYDELTRWFSDYVRNKDYIKKINT